MRINKFLSLAGVASRRKSEELVMAEQVSINGEIVKKLATEVDANNDIVRVDGKIIKQKPLIYLAFHKPKGCVCTASDEKNRKTIFAFLSPHQNEFKPFSVGRLDYNTEGLLIITNDGELAQKLTHPKFEIEKTYVAVVDGKVAESDLAKLRKGVEIDGKLTKPANVRVLSTNAETSRIEISIKEGRNQQVRKMFASIGKEVQFLTRKSVGSLKLGGLARGTTRELTPKEISALKRY